MKLLGPEGKALIIIERGEKLVETLTRQLQEMGLNGGVISGIGALKEVELGYYDLHQKTYERKLFAGEDFELLQLSGNLSLKDNQPYVHVHGILGRRDFSTFGGHLFEAVVAVTAEVYVLPLGKMPVRQFNPDLGLAVICGIC